MLTPEKPMPKITIFSAPKPFTNPHIALIQRNAIRSWLALGPLAATGDEVEVILVGEEEGLAEAASELNVLHIREVERNSYGTPLIRSIFDLARKAGKGELLAYINADILLLPDFLEASERVAALADRFLIVGQRWDLDVLTPLDFSRGWDRRLNGLVDEAGKLHPAGGSDYFVFPRDCFSNIPALAVGRAGWDNWMIYEARRRGWPVIDATADVRIIHQSHDYSHLPEGKPHYRLPETDENVRLGGGKLTIFKLADATDRLEVGNLKGVRFGWQKFWREVEIVPLVRLHSRWLAWVFFAIFHPIKAYAELRMALSKTQ
jgi:hypothetical protein